MVPSEERTDWSVMAPFCRPLNNQNPFWSLHKEYTGLRFASKNEFMSVDEFFFFAAAALPEESDDEPALLPDRSDL